MKDETKPWGLNRLVAASGNVVAVVNVVGHVVVVEVGPVLVRRAQHLVF